MCSSAVVVMPLLRTSVPWIPTPIPWWIPSSKKWLWASTRPGMTVAPPRSTIRVFSPISASTAASSPTATMRPSETASADTLAESGATVINLPLTTTTSAGGVIETDAAMPGNADVGGNESTTASAATTTAIPRLGTARTYSRPADPPRLRQIGGSPTVDRLRRDRHAVLHRSLGT